MIALDQSDAWGGANCWNTVYM